MQNTNTQLSMEEAGRGFTFLFSWKNRAHKQVLCPTKWNYLEVWWRLVKINLWKKYKYTERNLHLIFVAIKKSNSVVKNNKFHHLSSKPKTKTLKKIDAPLPTTNCHPRSKQNKAASANLEPEKHTKSISILCRLLRFSKISHLPGAGAHIFVFVYYFVEFSLALCVKTR